VLALYDGVAIRRPGRADRWIKGAVAVVEPSPEEIFKSCKLALAFGKLMDEENATALTADCYGSMWRKLPAYPCIGFTRLNDMGLGGICQSDLPCVMVHALFQGLVGRPGFVCNPTFDFPETLR
jgi:L-fucose isomerase-like protein